MADAVFTIDLKGNLTFLSPKTGEMTGYSVQQLLSMNIKELIAPEDLPAVLKRLDARSRGINELSATQFKLVRKDGTRLPIEVHTSLLCEGNKPVGVQGVARDVTERKRMEEALRNSEARFREMANLLPQIVFEIDPKGNYTFVNRSGIASAGYTEEEILSGLNALQTFIEQDRASIKKKIGRVLAGEELGTSEYTALRKDGTTFPVMIHSTPIIHDGKPVGLRGIAMDITERKRMEDALRESETRFRELADLLPQIVFETDEKGTLRFCNRVGLSATGYSEEDLRKGYGVFQAFPPEDARRAIESMRRIMNGEHVDPAEYTLLKKDGTSIPVIIYSSAIIREGKPVGLRGIIVDITERKLMEENLLKSKHLATIGETAALVGHDLRNPLQGIMGASYVLRTLEGNLSESGKEMLQVIEDAIKRSDKIINDLLEYSRELNLDLSTSNAKSIIDQTLASMQIPEGIYIINDAKEEPTVEVDVEKMKRVCLNIMTNAVDAMPNGGTLTITNTESDGNLLVRFADTGEGIGEEILAKMWIPLFTTKAKGMGYGLAIVKRFMEVHGGSVSVESNPGKGSTFTIKLPIHRTARTPIETQTEMMTAA